MKVKSVFTWIVLLFPLAFLVACTKDDPNKKVTIPVRGEIYVDGNPVTMLQIIAHPEGGMDRQQPTITQGSTSEDGKFELSTYAYADGAPPGTYKLTFVWQQYNSAAGSFQGPDKFKGHYDSPESSTVSLSVEKGNKAVDMGRIDLSTQN